MEYRFEIEGFMNKQKKKIHPFMVLFFIFYILLLFYLLFFSESYGRTLEEQKYRYNLELFKEIKRFWNYRETLGLKTVVINLIGNIVAFMPFGFFLPLFSNMGRNFFSSIFFSAFFSFLVEGIQLVTKVGAFDVDDIFLNTLGGFIGFLIYCSTKLFFHKKIKERINQKK